MGLKITINGRQNDGVDQMAAEDRRLYEAGLQSMGAALPDENRDGIPDILQGKGPSEARVLLENRILVNGKSYGSVDEMPEDARQLYEQAVQRVREEPGLKIAAPKPGFGLSFTFSRPGSTGSQPAGASPYETRGTGRDQARGAESGIRTALMVLVGLLLAGMALLVYLGTR